MPITRLQAIHVVRFLAILVAVVLPCHVASVRGEDAVIGENLVANPSFEEAKPGEKLPASWSGDAAVYGIDREMVHSGKAALKHQNADANRYRLASQKVKLTPGAKYRVRVWVKTDRVEGNESGATACVEWRDKDGKWMGGCYLPGVKGTSDWQQIEGCMRIPKAAASCTLSCYLRTKMTGTAWFDDVEMVRIAEQRLSSMLVSPVYRGWITKECDKVVLALRLNLADYDGKMEPANVATRLTNAAGQVVAFDGKPAATTVHRGLFGEKSEARLEFSAGSLPVGKYRLTVALQSPEAKTLEEVSHDFERVSDAFHPACSIDAKRRVLLNGKLFFPLGMYWGGIKEDDLKVYAKSKFNCIMPYASPNDAQMDLAEKYGIKVIYSVKDWYYGTHWCPKNIRSEADEEPQTVARVQKYRNHPALLAWYLNDELPQTYLKRLIAHHEWVAREDANHPTWTVLCHPTEVGVYHPCFDVVGTDPYPIGRKPASEAADWTVETNKQVLGARPMWQVPQVFNWANYHKDDPKPEYRTPTSDEMRSMAWQCIAEGATGLVFYSWSDIHRNPDVPFGVQWERLQKIAEEIDRFAPMLLSVESVPAIAAEPSASADSRPWLRWTARAQGGKLYVFVVNDGDGEGEVRFTLPAAPKAVKSLTEGSQATIDGAVVRSELKRLAVQVYEIEP